MAHFYFRARQNNSRVQLIQSGSTSVVNLECSTDETNWSIWDRDTTLSSGQTIYLRGDNPDGYKLNSTNFNRFTATGAVEIGGDIRSLVDVTMASTIVPCNSCFEMLFAKCTSLVYISNELLSGFTTLTLGCYRNMFDGCSSITSAPSLPATASTEDCYASMFMYCSSLTVAPSLPATTLANGCYSHMFDSCTSLTTEPELPATTLAEYCYAYMFYGCTSLTTAPELPATTLEWQCYNHMFYNCTSLTTAPALPATALTEGCYASMFYGCSSLTTAPALPATALIESCYASMFQGCTSLTTAPILPATTLPERCYGGMFSNCTNLNYIKCLATDISASNCTYYWLNGVASTGTFVKNASATNWTTGVSGIPNGWTVRDDAPASMSANPTTFSAIPYSGGVADSSIVYANMNISTVSATTSESWLHWEWLDNITKEDIEITIDSNAANSGRTGTVVISGRDIDSGLHSQTITITQEARPRGSMSADTTSISFDHSGGDVFVEMAYNHINGATVSATTEADWLDFDWRDQTGRPHYELKVECDENTGLTPRSATVTIFGPDEYGNTLSITVSVVQGSEDIFPIWKDIYYSGSTSTLDYYIIMDDTDLIYQGRAYIQPGKENVEINISKICQNYLSNDIEDGLSIIDPISFVVYGNDAIHTFQLYNASGDTLLKEYTYLYDWSYEELSSSIILTHPINGHCDSRMVRVGTEVVMADSQYLNHSINSLYTTGYCGDYALYYQQRNGGWAAFLIEGNSKKTDSYNKYNYNMAFNNTKAQFEESVYHNEISTDYELHTGWLTDIQADNLAFNLLSSNRMFLHNLKTNKIMPVVVDNNEAEYKTFKNNGKHMVNYTINVKASQKKQLL